MARGWVIFPSMRVLRVCEAFSSRATLMVFLGPSSVQYKLSAIQSTAMPSTVWIPENDIPPCHYRKCIALTQITCRVLSVSVISCQYPTFLHNSIPLRPINLLASDDVAGGIGKVNELAASVEVQSSGVHQVLYGDHVLIRHLGIHVHTPDDPRATFTVDQEKLVLGLCSRTRQQSRNAEART